MTPASNPCDRQMIWTVSLVVLASLSFAFTLEFSGHAGASAAFIGVAVAALGILSPSPLKQHGQSSEPAAPAVSATTTTGDVSVNQPVVPPPVADSPPAS